MPNTRRILDYMEVRIASQNWESAFFAAVRCVVVTWSFFVCSWFCLESLSLSSFPSFFAVGSSFGLPDPAQQWLQQIILSELLDVPTTLESGTKDARINFYDYDNALDYGVGYPWEGLRIAMRDDVQGDCRKVAKKTPYEENENDEDYVPCAHVIPEIWTPRTNTVLGLEKEGVIVPFQFLGTIASGGWYVPKFLLERDPSLATYLGLAGEKHRKKLSETFRTPTTWSEYCSLVSSDNCTYNDGIAARAPSTEEEGGRYFEEALYTGHFRTTFSNNCTANPECTGTIVDYPCGWSSFVVAQTYHNNISLTGTKYSYSNMVEIYHAANATRSGVVMQWWEPEGLYESFRATGSQFERVNLPPPSKTCLENRIEVEYDRCSGNLSTEIGNPLGACDMANQGLKKVVSKSLYDASFDKSTDEARRSPAYSAVREFRISAEQIGDILRLWQDLGDPRTAVCNWYVC